MRWPLLVLAVLVVALLGAALADSLTGGDTGSTGRADVPGYARAAAEGGMISEHVPGAAAPDARTTTAKDA